MELSERKLKVLQAIISDYVRTAEPVGSRTLSKKPELDYSPATIRNEMADLEEMGYLTHPHTSAGRVPSDKAYRLYVNALMEKKELSKEEKNIIADRLRGRVNDFEKTIEYAASVLSEITNLTSFALTPSKDEDVLKYINLLPVDEHTVVLMIVSESGKVSNKAVRMSVPYTEDNLQLLSKTMTYNYKGKTISQALTNNIIANVETDIVAMSGLAEDVMPNFGRHAECQPVYGRAYEHFRYSGVQRPFEGEEFHRNAQPEGGAHQKADRKRRRHHGDNRRRKFRRHHAGLLPDNRKLSCGRQAGRQNRSHRTDTNEVRRGNIDHRIFDRQLKRYI